MYINHSLPAPTAPRRRTPRVARVKGAATGGDEDPGKHAATRVDHRERDDTADPPRRPAADAGETREPIIDETV